MDAATRISAMATELARESELFLGVMARHSGCEEEKIAPAIDSVLGSNAKDIKAHLNQFDSAFTTSFAPLLAFGADVAVVNWAINIRDLVQQQP